jgi:tetratricopeptide (TPR) repeat protein
VLAFVGLFLILSFVMFPKGRLNEILLTQEDYNLDLSRLYLEKLLDIKFDSKLFSLLIEKDVKLGRYEEAHRLIEKYLEKIRDKKQKKFLYQLDFKILVSEYFAQKDNKEREKIKEEIRKFLESYERTFPSIETYRFVYKEALAFGFKDLAYRSCEKLAKLTGDENYYKQLMVLAISSGDKKLIADTLKILMRKGEIGKDFDKELFKTALYLKQKRTVEQLAYNLLHKGEFSFKDFKTLVNFELSYKDYDRALEFCKVYLKKNSSFNVLKTCIDLALWKRDYGSVSQLIEENLDKYSNNDSVLNYFLDVARAINDRKLSLRIADMLLKRVSGGN